jgi:hypothetical protein
VHQSTRGAAARAARSLSFSLPRALCAAALSALLAPTVHASCGTAFCSVNSDWGAISGAPEEGGSFDLRYEYIKQDQPRAGSSKVGVGELPRHHDEVRTENRNLLATYRHTFASGWGFTVTLPGVDREHLHIHNHRGAKLEEAWDFTEFGDARVLGRYQRVLPGSDDAPRTGALVLGLKLPTGRTNIANDAGQVAERSLQPGTGTTDIVLGAAFHQVLGPSGASWFAQAQLQEPLNSHNEYKPGTQFGIDLGYSRPITGAFSAMIQLNLLSKGRDSGAEAEAEDSGGRFVYLSPGVSFGATESMRLYAFYQLPVYQYVNGVQLTASGGFVVGVSARF